MKTVFSRNLQFAAFTLFVMALSTECGIHEYDTPTSKQFEEFLKHSDNKTKYDRLYAFLQKNGVGEVVPVEQLLRQGTDWRKTNMSPFAVPPKRLWGNIVPTLKLLKEQIIPLVGKVEVLSGFRMKDYNKAAGGAAGSKHLVFSALDVIPKHRIGRAELHSKLEELWQSKGWKYAMGLGLYSRIRFHVDTARYRKW